MRVAHKNLLFEAIRQTKCGVEAFDIIDDDGDTKITLKGTPLEFTIIPTLGNYNGYYHSSVAYAKKFPFQKYMFAEQIDVITRRFTSWLSDHAVPCFEDKNMIDLWEEYKSGTQYLQIGDLQTSDVTYFSQDDVVRIRFAIEDLKVLIPAKFQVTEDQMKIVN